MAQLECFLAAEDEQLALNERRLHLRLPKKEME